MVIFSRFLKVAITTSNIMNETLMVDFCQGLVSQCQGKPSPNHISLYAYIYIYNRETERGRDKKLAEKCMWKRNMKSFSDEILNFFFRKFWVSYILDIPKTVLALQLLSQKATSNFGIKELRGLKNHAPVNLLLCSSHFTEAH